MNCDNPHNNGGSCERCRTHSVDVTQYKTPTTGAIEDYDSDNMSFDDLESDATCASSEEEDILIINDSISMIEDEDEEYVDRAVFSGYL